jgi:hypothetical protein
MPTEIFVGPISASGRSGAGGKEACACSARAVPISSVARKAMPSAKGVRRTRIVIPISVRFRISRRFLSASADVAQGPGVAVGVSAGTGVAAHKREGQQVGGTALWSLIFCGVSSDQTNRKQGKHAGTDFVVTTLSVHVAFSAIGAGFLSRCMMHQMVIVA